MPGVYADEQGGMHIDVSELLRAQGFADTPQNRATLTKAAQEFFIRQYPAVTKVTVIE